jgi:ABC-type Fe3+ transport system permease subunit
MLLFLAGLQNISTTYYEAAELDGANNFQKFRHITWPLLSPTTFFVFVMSVISSFQVFDLVQLMTRGGPGRATSTLVHYIYQNGFKFFYMGYASALAYLLFCAGSCHYAGQHAVSEEGRILKEEESLMEARAKTPGQRVKRVLLYMFLFIGAFTMVIPSFGWSPPRSNPSTRYSPSADAFWLPAGV